jgi:type I restriction enzyme M protein
MLIPNSATEAAMTIEDVVHPALKGQEFSDVILTNPPFAGEIRESDLLDSYDNSRGKSRVERDVLFVERWVNLSSLVGDGNRAAPQ